MLPELGGVCAEDLSYSFTDVASGNGDCAGFLRYGGHDIQLFELFDSALQFGNGAVDVFYGAKFP